MTEVMCVSVPRNFRSISFEKISFSQWKCERKQKFFSWNSLKFSTLIQNLIFSQKYNLLDAKWKKFDFIERKFLRKDIEICENFGRKWTNFVSTFLQISFKENFDGNPECASVIRNLFAKQYDWFLLPD